MHINKLKKLIEQLDEINEGIYYLKHNHGALSLPASARAAMMDGLEGHKDLLEATLDVIGVEV